jgi:hypothetical protein
MPPPSALSIERYQRLLRFLSDLSQGNEQTRMVTPTVVSSALSGLSRLNEATGDTILLCTPTATPGPDGQLMLVWRRGPHYLELEVFEGGRWEFYYHDESTDEMIDCDTTAGQPIPQAILARIAEALS